MPRKKSEEKAAKPVEQDKKIDNSYLDIEALKKSVEKIKKHLARNIHDFSTLRALSIKQAKLNKLIKYRS